jgi:hypothetical protein
MICLILDLRFSQLSFNVTLRLSEKSHDEYWELSNVSANIEVAILKARTADMFAETFNNSQYSTRLLPKGDILH